jgi:hypothetical protein
MKQKKALKRLAKSESLISDVTERYSASAPDAREVLQDAKASVARAKETVSLQASSGMARKTAAARKKTAVEKAAAKAVAAQTPKKSAPVKKAVKKKLSAPVQAAMEA